MTTQELKNKLKKEGIPENTYSLLIGGFPNEAYCLIDTKNPESLSDYRDFRMSKERSRGLRLASHYTVFTVRGWRAMICSSVCGR